MIIIIVWIVCALIGVTILLRKHKEIEVDLTLFILFTAPLTTPLIILGSVTNWLEENNFKIVIEDGYLKFKKGRKEDSYV